MMLYTKYESYGPCSFRDFFKIAFWKPFFFTLWPIYATNLIHFGRGPFLLSLVKFPLVLQEKMSFELFLIHFNVKWWPPGEVWSKSNEQFHRRLSCWRTTNFVLMWAKKASWLLLVFTVINPFFHLWLQTRPYNISYFYLLSVSLWPVLSNTTTESIIYLTMQVRFSY